MNIIVTRLKLVNFKGIRELEIFPHAEITTITGDNGKGKSTVPAAFNWLFTGKDQFDRAVIDEIKTYDKDGKHIEKIDHWVEADLLIDSDRTITIKRVLCQNWVKRRGETERILDGHKNEYFINGVGTGTETAFKQELSQIIEDRTFKLLTNPLFFNEILEWKERREILFSMAPPITDEEVVKLITNKDNESRIVGLNNILNSGASFERYKKELSNRKKQKNEQLILIPAKIDATERTKPEVPDGGFGVVEHQIKKLQAELDAIDIELSDKSKANESLLEKQRAKQQTIHNLKSALQDAQQKARSNRQNERNIILDSISDIDNKIKTEQRKIESLQSEIDANTREITKLTEHKEFAKKRGPELAQQKEDLINEFYEVDATKFEFDAENCMCTACKRPFTGNDLAEKRSHYESIFNKDKSDKLDRIDAQGLVIKNDIEKYNNNIKDFDQKIADLEEKNLSIAESQATIKDSITTLEDQRAQVGQQLVAFDAATRPESEEEKNLSVQILEAELKIGEVETSQTASIDPEESTNDNTTGPDPQLLEEKKRVQGELDKLKAILTHKEQIEKADKLIAEYTEDERKLAQEVADIEKDEDIMQEFSRTRIESIESRVNSMFQFVKFKLFDAKLNGEEKECCEATVNGVPFRILNTAMKVNAGLDIINVLSKHFGRTLPIFIDNRESISELVPTQSQIINLEKVKGQTTLKIQ